MSISIKDYPDDDTELLIPDSAVIEFSNLNGNSSVTTRFRQVGGSTYIEISGSGVIEVLPRASNSVWIKCK